MTEVIATCYLLLCAMAVKVNAWLRSFWKDIECPVPQSFPDVQGGGEGEARPEQVQHQLAAGQVINRAANQGFYEDL